VGGGAFLWQNIEWEMQVHIHDDPPCVWMEGCPSPLSLVSPVGVKVAEWQQWGRNLRRHCTDGVMSQQHAILRAKLDGLRCALATPRVCRDKSNPALLVTIAPVPAPSNPAAAGSFSAGSDDAEQQARTRLYACPTIASAH
jgi:hypothetical protein